MLTGTLLERTRVPLPVWRAIVADMVAVRTGELSARALARRHAVTPETARLLTARMLAAGVPPGTDAGADADAALARLLRLPPADVDRIRRSTPARRASHYGPTGDYG